MIASKGTEGAPGRMISTGEATAALRGRSTCGVKNVAVARISCGGWCADVCAPSTVVTCKPGAGMTPLEKLAYIARTNPVVLPIRRVIQSTMTAAAGAFGVALIAAPCYAEAAPVSGTNTPASTTSAPAKQPARSDDAAIRPFRVNIPQAALDDLRKHHVKEREVAAPRTTSHAIRAQHPRSSTTAPGTSPARCD